MRTKINDYIIVDSEICGGTPIFKGTRIMVWQVLELLGAGISVDEILQNYFPSLTKPAIFSVMTYASKLIEEKKHVLLQN